MDTSNKSITKRTQRDYTLSFKLAVIEQVEQGDMTYKQAQYHYGIQGKSTVLVWLRRYGRLDWSPQGAYAMSRTKETPAQKIKRLEQELEDEQLKCFILNGMVDEIDRLTGSQLRKKCLTIPLLNPKKKTG